MTRVVFVCVSNGGKSQMAAGFFRALVAEDPDPGRWQVSSAGTRAGSMLNALSVESLADVGIDIGDQRPRQLTPGLQESADLVVIVGPAVVERVDGPRYEFWEIDEPSLRGVDGAERMALVRDDVARHVEDLHERLVAADRSGTRLGSDRTDGGDPGRDLSRGAAAGSRGRSAGSAPARP